MVHKYDCVPLNLSKWQYAMHLVSATLGLAVEASVHDHLGAVPLFLTQMIAWDAMLHSH